MRPDEILALCRGCHPQRPSSHWILSSKRDGRLNLAPGIALAIELTADRFLLGRLARGGGRDSLGRRLGHEPRVRAEGVSLRRGGAKRITRKPATADNSEPSRMPIFASSTAAAPSAPGKASVAMNRLIVKPIPHRMLTP